MLNGVFRKFDRLFPCSAIDLFRYPYAALFNANNFKLPAWFIIPYVRYCKLCLQ